MNTLNINEYIEENILKIEISHRGGGILIDASEYLKINDAKVVVYQNYLGGGIAGRVASDCNLIINKLASAKQKKLKNLQNALINYYYKQAGYDDVDQDLASILPISAY